MNRQICDSCQYFYLSENQQYRGFHKKRATRLWCKSNDIATQCLSYYPAKAKRLHCKKVVFASKSQYFFANITEKQSPNRSLFAIFFPEKNVPDLWSM